MSLLLDARTKARQLQNGNNGADHELSLEPLPETGSSPVQSARMAGHNLFNAKSTPPKSTVASINRNLLIALGGTIVLLAVGGAYVWYQITPHPAQPLHLPPPPPPVNAVVQNTQTQPSPQVLPETSPPAKTQASTPSRPVQRKTVHKSRSDSGAQTPVIAQHREEPIDPILNDAYLAYRAGKYDQAQSLYQQVLKLDARNSDALLGLAAIAQRRGEDNLASHYYSQVLALDPRNAVANAGMSALTTNENRESRLKDLLGEQQNSSSLYFALGNQYAEQSRWAEAQQAYSNAYKLNPANAELSFNLAVSLDRLGQNKAAAQYYQRALQLDSANIAGFDHAKISQRIDELMH